MALEELGPGEVGFVAANIRSVHDTKIGDTLTHAKRRAPEALKGYKDVKPMVFAGIFPTDNADYAALRDALDKLRLNDSSFQFEPDTSEALGFGFRCGFLGLFHMEIIQERLEREYNLDLLITAPSVVYKVKLRSGEEVDVENPSRLPDIGKIASIEEPFLKLTLHSPAHAIGAIMQLCQDRRGTQVGMQYVRARAGDPHVRDAPQRGALRLLRQAQERVEGLRLDGLRAHRVPRGPLVRVDLLVNGEPVDALSVILHKDKAQKRGRELALKLKEVIHRQQYEVAIQAAIGGKIIARETLGALRKNVTAKCYGGDISRKRKLLEKQKEGKKRMKSVGSVEIPQEAFLAILKVD
jgi:GTP-binding protein LepA